MSDAVGRKAVTGIVLLSDLRTVRQNKQAELEYYEGQLRVLQTRMSIVQAEIRLTTTILNMIEKEKVMCVYRPEGAR